MTTIMQTLPTTITTKQTKILKLLYTYRFLTRPQLQKLLNHKDKRQIISWLKDLRDNEFIDWIYDADEFMGYVYFLSLNFWYSVLTSSLIVFWNVSLLKRLA